MNSTFNWGTRLPNSWKTLPLKAVAYYTVSSVDKLINEEEIPVDLCNYTDVYNNDFITLDIDFMKASATKEEIEKFSLQEGDVLITKDSESWDDIAIPALVKQTKPNLLCGYHLAIIRPDNKKIHPSFLFRCLQSKQIRLQLELASTGVTRFGLPKDEIGTAVLPVPDIKSQILISDYIDEVITEIELLISSKTKLLKLLSEKRQSLITNAVTKGLNQIVKLKDSNIHWLSKVPEHWLIERSKWLFRERNERSETGEEELLTVSHLTGVTLRSEKNVNMFEAETTEGYKKCYKNDLVINTLWAWMGAMGVSPTDGIVSPAYHVYIPAPTILASYVDLIVRLPLFASEVIRYSKGVWSSRLRLYPEGFYEVFLPVPPLNEQEQIVNFIKSELEKIDDMTIASKKSITLLEERKASLITAAVTGQIQIPTS